MILCIRFRSYQVVIIVSALQLWACHKSTCKRTILMDLRSLLEWQNNTRVYINALLCQNLFLVSKFAPQHRATADNASLVLQVIDRLLNKHELDSTRKLCNALFSGDIDTSKHRHDLGSHGKGVDSA